MSHSGSLEENNNVGSEQCDNKSSDDELTRISAFTKADSELLELLVIRTFQHVIEPLIEPLIRKAVHEGLELVQEKFVTNKKCNCGNGPSTSESRSLELKFLDKISVPVLTGKKIEGEGLTSIRVALIDPLTGQVVKSGPESASNVEIVVLEGNFGSGGGDSWTTDEFNNKIVRERKGKKSLLRGNICLKLREGVSSIGQISFTHNSGWMKSCEVCLGARAMDNFPGTIIKAAKTESFILKDRRSALYDKHYPPNLNDEVWRIEGIGKDGVFHNRLIQHNINKVKEFLILFYTNPQKLKEVLDAGAKNWEAITEHARTCTIDEGLYLYNPNSQQKSQVVFNVVGQVKGVLRESHYVPVDKLSEKEKEDAQIVTYEHWVDVVPFDYETSPVSGTFHSSKSPLLESPDDHNCSAPLYDHMQPGTSSDGIISSVVEESSRLNDINFSSHVDNMELYPDRPIYSPNYVTQFFDDGNYMQHLTVDNGHRPENPNADSQAEQQTAATGFLLVGSRAVSIDKAQKRWTFVSRVLRFAMRKRIIAPEGLHFPKKRRVC